MKFNKPAVTLPEQLEILKSRGLLINCDSSATSILENIGYYRFSAYSHPFRHGAERNTFKEGTTIEQIIRIYDFDRELRLLITDAIERIEIAMRARVVNQTSVHFNDPHWFMNPVNFHPQFHHSTFLNKLERSLEIKRDKVTGARVLPTSHPETFIEHYYHTYGDPYLPPAWMAAEVLSLGSLSRVYQGIGPSLLKQSIAAPFGVPAKILSKWLHSLAHLRNVCAHHGRIWNRIFSISPPNANIHKGVITTPKRLDGQLIVLLSILDVCSPNHHWRDKFKALTIAYPEVDHSVMGFPTNWQDKPIWQNTH